MSDITEMLGRAKAGDASAVQDAYASLYPELCRIAHGRLRRSLNHISPDTTSLVHDTNLRLVQTKAVQVADRNHFLAYASTVMRSVIVDLIRESQADRRGGGQMDVTLDTGIADASAERSSEEALDVHEALQRLEQINARMAKVVEMRYFAGLNDSEIAESLGLAARTVGRDWEKARVFLYMMLQD